MQTTTRKVNGFVGASAIVEKRFVKYDPATQLIVPASSDDLATYQWGISEMPGEAAQDSPLSIYRSGHPVKVTAGEALPWGCYVKSGADGKAVVAHAGELALGRYDHPVFSGTDEKTPMAVRSGADANICLFECPYRVGQGARISVEGELDFAVDGGAIGTIKLRRPGFEVGDADADIQVPANARVLFSGYDVLTTFTSATDAATIALLLGAGAEATIKAATAISAGGNVWDAGAHDGAHDNTAANSEKTTAAADLVAVVAVEAVTAGKLRCLVEYWLPGVA